ncbi:MAG: DUF4397 domain-containing protein [Saprospiraceae bacterium]
MYKNIVFLISLCFIIINSCSKDDTGPTTSKAPIVSFIDGIYDQFGVLAVVVKDSTTYYEKMGFGGNIPPKNVPSGANFIKFTETTTSNQLFATNINFNNNKNYTVAICNKKSSVEVFSFENNFSLADTNNTAFRFLNLIPNSNLQITINGLSMGLTNYNFKGFSNYVELPITPVTIKVKDLISNKDLITVNNYKGFPKKIYNIYFIGVVGGTGGQIPSFSSVAVN